MRKISIALSAFILIGTATVASATPLTTIAPPVDLSNRSGSMVQKIHDWHRYCEWGPRRFHRHIPGVGNVRCGRHRRRYRRRISRCEAWFNECRSRWGRRSWRFDRCMVRHGC